MTARLVVADCSGNLDMEGLADKQELVGDDPLGIDMVVLVAPSPDLPIEPSLEDVDVGGEFLPLAAVTAGEEPPSSCGRASC
jgi:hypothetical protein